ncbi:nucleoside phosphorylase [Kosmotoga olearia]|jgi:uridine phosphorylase|uniref:Uridine phosphorylase n=1 Tax=Kosmotoga olearia (strain ATCC BAA-1733 / DSM 21960 / TBF 19.5.1) TaxID=521045 RepID=C5CF76_KOSOT|nr:nucleoside phosphorylase [Kosmotoga olearia]ACR79353.1 purine or other phosphorylase family 1 [Kosmotoga olearia TBF 19.5.1]
MKDNIPPILEFDGTTPAVIEPGKIIKPLPQMPEKVILVFYQEVIDFLRDAGKLRLLNIRRSEVGEFPIYLLEYKEQQIAVFNPGLGAPCAAGFYEELIALGAKKTIACGSAGVVNPKLKRGSIVIVDSAVRDEGTSYHYLPPSREIKANEKVIKIIEETLKDLGVPYVKGKTWTTDAFYRETQNRVKKRLAEGCVTVEMEASALMAVSEFRGVEFGQILSSSDDVSGTEWDPRIPPEASSHKEKIFWLAAECLIRL